MRRYVISTARPSVPRFPLMSALPLTNERSFQQDFFLDRQVLCQINFAHCLCFMHSFTRFMSNFENIFICKVSLAMKLSSVFLDLKL